MGHPLSPALYKEDDSYRLHSSGSFALQLLIRVGQWGAPTRDQRIRERGWGIFPYPLPALEVFSANGCIPSVPPSSPLLIIALTW